MSRLTDEMDKKRAATDNIERDPWDQEPDEPAYWHKKFTEYRLMGPDRTLTRYFRLCRAMEGKEVTASTHPNDSWRENARRWRWEERAKAWDEEMIAEAEAEARKVLTAGLALAFERVKKLSQLAERLEGVLLDTKVKLSPFLIEQYRGLLKDIADEKGERTKETRITGVGGGPILIETTWGRGGSANAAWQQALDAPKVVIEEVPNQKDNAE